MRLQRWVYWLTHPFFTVPVGGVVVAGIDVQVWGLYTQGYLYLWHGAEWLVFAIGLLTCEYLALSATALLLTARGDL